MLGTEGPADSTRGGETDGQLLERAAELAGVEVVERAGKDMAFSAPGVPPQCPSCSSPLTHLNPLECSPASRGARLADDVLEHRVFQVAEQQYDVGEVAYQPSLPRSRSGPGVLPHTMDHAPAGGPTALLDGADGALSGSQRL